MSFEHAGSGDAEADAAAAVMQEPRCLAGSTHSSSNNNNSRQLGTPRTSTGGTATAALAAPHDAAASDQSGLPPPMPLARATLCILQRNQITCATPGGELHEVPLLEPCASIWPLQRGLLLAVRVLKTFLYLRYIPNDVDLLFVRLVVQLVALAR